MRLFLHSTNFRRMRKAASADSHCPILSMVGPTGAGMCNERERSTRIIYSHCCYVAGKSSLIKRLNPVKPPVVAFQEQQVCHYCVCICVYSRAVTVTIVWFGFNSPPPPCRHCVDPDYVQRQRLPLERLERAGSGAYLGLGGRRRRSAAHGILVSAAVTRVACVLLI